MTDPTIRNNPERVEVEYSTRLERLRADESALAKSDHSVGNWRLLMFIVAVVILIGAFVANFGSPYLAGAPFLLFVWLAVRHDGIIRKRRRKQRSIAFYEMGGHRLRGTWAGRGATGLRFLDSDHPYALDLDIFGRGSLFELISTARTAAGETCLADWLKRPSEPETIVERQNAVRELTPRLDLRERVSVLGEEAGAGMAPSLTDWGREPILLQRGPIRRLLLFISVLTVVAAGVSIAIDNAIPFLVVVAVGQLAIIPLRNRARRVLVTAEKPAEILRTISGMLEMLESEKFDATRLRQLRALLESSGEPPSKRIAALQGLIDYVDAARNQFFVLIAEALLWRVHCAFAIEAWREAHGAKLGDWVTAIGEYEALSSLATYAYEHPNDCYPTVAADVEPFLTARDVGHPLMGANVAVRNEVDLGGAQRLWIVSGSNMSGKSTLLRTVGSNAVMALAGAPVRAAEMRLTVLHIGASIRTEDSLQAGVSRFYAEIKRIKQVVDIGANEPPLLFLLDEILHGTNSHDRRVGAEAILRTLMRESSVGLVTTHDLALAKIADDPDLPARNIHFEDVMIDGTMTFDYRLHDGVVTRSNAIALMRAVGLEV